MTTHRAVWEHAVLSVDQTWTEPDGYRYVAGAWVGSEQIYDKVLTEYYWSVPLEDLGKEGWEVVGTAPHNSLIPGFNEGFPGSISMPVRMVFFLKRPA